jgi:hypothetical protein
LAISNVGITNITSTGATITWTSSRPAQAQIGYGRASTYGQVTTLDTTFTSTAHTQSLINLSPSTQYHYRTYSKDANGMEAYSADNTFTTLPPVATPGNYTVPASIDATGATDVSTALSNFIASVPDGSTITFPSGGSYRVDTPITMTNRNGLTFVGNSSTIKSPSHFVGTQEILDSPMVFRGGDLITISDFVAVNWYFHQTQRLVLHIANGIAGLTSIVLDQCGLLYAGT